MALDNEQKKSTSPTRAFSLAHQQRVFLFFCFLLFCFLDCCSCCFFNRVAQICVVDPRALGHTGAVGGTGHSLRSVLAGDNATQAPSDAHAGDCVLPCNVTLISELPSHSRTTRSFNFARTAISVLTFLSCSGSGRARATLGVCVYFDPICL